MKLASVILLQRKMLDKKGTQAISSMLSVTQLNEMKLHREIWTKKAKAIHFICTAFLDFQIKCAERTRNRLQLCYKNTVSLHNFGVIIVKSKLLENIAYVP